jgi:hypothetical protein
MRMHMHMHMHAHAMHMHTYAHAMPMLCTCCAHALQHVEVDAHNRRGDTALTEAARAGKVAPHHAAAPRCRTALLRLD